MSDMVERVAKAIYEDRQGPGATAWARRPLAHRKPYLDDARAAIKAMRDNLKGNLVPPLIALAHHNIPTDIQELLVQGNPMMDVPPGGLAAAIDATLGEGK